MGIRHMGMAVLNRLMLVHMTVWPGGWDFMGVRMMPIVVGVCMLMHQGFMVMFMVM